MKRNHTNEVCITFPTGRQDFFPYGIRVIDLLKEKEFDGAGDAIVGGLINNEVVSLTFRVEVNSVFEPVMIASRDGARIFRRSLCFLLNAAAAAVFPGRRLVIGHSLGDSYFFYFDDEPETSADDVSRLESRMQELVKADLPITRSVLSYNDAMTHLKETGNRSAEQLLEHLSDSKITIHECAGFRDIAHGPLVLHSGLLGHFELAAYPPGFLLRFPPVDLPGVVEPLKEHPVVFSIFQEYKRWGKVLGVSNAGQLNDLISRGKIKDFIQVAEALHDKKMAEIANAVYEKRDSVRLILIAGPSCSGKTTFTKKLLVQLKVLGYNPVSISVDDYFLPRDQTPLDKNGEYDFEALEALDVGLFNDHVCGLLDGDEVEIPDFDFKTGKSNPAGKPLKLESRSIIVVEGIHCLNPKLTFKIKPEKKFSIYVSALTQLNIDDHNRIPTTDVRLLRRLVRDHQFRGYSAVETLTRWPSVRNGEIRNIFPHENNAQIAFNSALDYELAILKGFAEPLLSTVKPFDPVYGEAVRLRQFLSNFIMVPSKYSPYYSILREYIGDSGFTY
ncbi:MAG: nucleoside kinase [Spirochaetales bacterium]|nr:nucleoside kinase [Spirochaetales bacterium]